LLSKGEKTMTERIVAAAILYREMIITLPPPARHGTLIAVMTHAFGEVDIMPRMQGFVTSTGRYVGRKEAALIAFDAGQITDLKPELYSEDVW
jgi:hypothetical protein